MSKETVFLRFKGEIYHSPNDNFITIFLANPKPLLKPKEYKIPKSAVLFYVPGKKSTEDEILISLSDEDYKALKMPKFKNFRVGSKGTEGLPPKVIGVPPKLEYFVEGFEVRSNH
ncbi:MAG: hypothetical protein IPH28_24140 [Cytophagaceae bacterium]|nr:hypothetical protein [Cytophagaceae bacterium]MBK9508033.1 hypothetical protein [Cytophagaceae bacterium]MBK9936441.1 hypothetical protein [Cytophagaceae bacterium]MBL0300190.1 hypothetical protein [Cytophagaceae bacterium]MBL0327126.1 hypothetical protein [Cytophagaceae bacterium]